MQRSFLKHTAIYCPIIMLGFLSVLYLIYPEDVVFPKILLPAFAAGIGGSIGSHYYFNRQKK